MPQFGSICTGRADGLQIIRGHSEPFFRAAIVPTFRDAVPPGALSIDLGRAEFNWVPKTGRRVRLKPL